MSDTIVFNNAAKQSQSALGKRPDFSNFSNANVAHWELTTANNIGNEDRMEITFNGVPSYKGNVISLMLPVEIPWPPHGTIKMFIRNISIPETARRTLLPFNAWNFQDVF